MNILHSIITHKQKEVAARKREVPLEKFLPKLEPSPKNFKKAIQRRAKQELNLIAEIKKASPSEGVLRPHLEKELTKIVAVYNRYASAISVVTDERFFQGHLEWIKKIRALTNLPILCKDFIVDEYQIYEARAHGADAVLLIVNYELRITNYELRKYVAIANELGMSCLIEVHNKQELDIALNAGAEIIGINNRDLETFTVSLDTTLSLAPYIPQDITIVSESGFKTRDDIKKMRGIVDAVLIGAELMKAKDIQETMELLTS